MEVCKEAGARIAIGNAAVLLEEGDDAMLRFFRRNKSEAETYLAECGGNASEAPDEGLVVLCSSEDRDAEWRHRVVDVTRQLSIPISLEGAGALYKAIVFADPRQYLNQMADFEDDVETLPPTAPPAQQQHTKSLSLKRVDDSTEDSQMTEMQIDRAASPPPTASPSAHTAISSTVQASPRKVR
jgi:hypothetical protein